MEQDAVSGDGRIMSRAASILLCIILLSSCGNQDDLSKENGENKISNDCTKFVPAGFTLESQLEGCGFALGVAKKGDGACPRILMIIKDGRLVRLSEEIICKSIVLGQEELVCYPIAEGLRGVAIEFEMTGNSYEDRFIKVIDDRELRDVPVALGAGFAAKDFSDSNYDGLYEITLIDCRWVGLRIFEKNNPPFTYKIATYRDGKFIEETSRFVNHLQAGIRQWTDAMVNAPTEIESAKAAVVLALIYRDNQQIDEGIALMEKVVAGAASQTLRESIEYFLKEYKKDGNPDWFYPARKQAWEPIRWQQTNTP